MEWTATRPQKPGWYWWRFNHEGDPEVVEVMSRDEPDPRYWQARFRHGERVVGLVAGEWCGPLKAPA